MTRSNATEIAHVVAMDRVGFSLLPIERKTRLSAELKAAVEASPAYLEAGSVGEVLSLDSGDGAAVVFFGDPLRAAQFAEDIQRQINAEAETKLRIGVHSGPVQRRTDIAGKPNLDGQGIDFAFRVMGFADGSGVLLSETAATFLSAYEAWSERLHEVGEKEAKHGIKIRVWRIGSLADRTGFKVAIVYKRHAEPDSRVLDVLERRLREAGHDVFVDRHLSIGVEWAQAIEAEIRSSEAVVALLSDRAANSEMVLYELQLAVREADRRGKPYVLPVRIGSSQPIEGEIGALVNRFQYAIWTAPEDDDLVCQSILDFLITPPTEPYEPIAPLEQPGGAVPLTSPYYISRPTDDEFMQAIRRRDSIVLVKGARQMGKTSLLARGVQVSRDLGSRVVLTDLQTFSGSQLDTDEKFYMSIAHAFAFQLGIQVSIREFWNEWLGANSNFESFVQSQILNLVQGHLVWALDEADRLFTYSYASDFFGLVRSWHNRRALEPSGPWSRLTMAIGYATEAHLFITDLNQSPFNVGTRLTLEDFSLEQVEELNNRYGCPLRSAGEIEGFYALLNGQPFLSRRGLDEMVRQRLPYSQLEGTADHEEGIFGDHLRRFLVALAGDDKLAQAIKGVLAGSSPDHESFFRLRSAGLLVGDSPATAQVRCGIYAKFFARHL